MFEMVKFPLNFNRAAVITQQRAMSPKLGASSKVIGKALRRNAIQTGGLIAELRAFGGEAHSVLDSSFI